MGFLPATVELIDETVMNILTVAASRYLWVVSTVLLIAYGACLTWQEWLFRQSVEVPVFTPLQTNPEQAPASFNPDSIAAVLGLSAGEALIRSAEPLELRASFVASQGQSHALLDDGEQARFYTVGERLPGGSVLRRVEVSHVVLWRNGREEHLALKPAAQYLLPVANSSLQKAQAASLHLRPIAEQP